jgi:hypothetical protein
MRNDTKETIDAVFEIPYTINSFERHDHVSVIRDYIIRDVLHFMYAEDADIPNAVEVVGELESGVCDAYVLQKFKELMDDIDPIVSKFSLN